MRIYARWESWWLEVATLSTSFTSGFAIIGLSPPSVATRAFSSLADNSAFHCHPPALCYFNALFFELLLFLHLLSATFDNAEDRIHPLALNWFRTLVKKKTKKKLAEVVKRKHASTTSRIKIPIIPLPCSVPQLNSSWMIFSLQDQKVHKCNFFCPFLPSSEMSLSLYQDKPSAALLAGFFFCLSPLRHFKKRSS